MEGRHQFEKPTRELSSRECEVLTLVRDGYFNKEIAAKLGIKEESVKSHLINIFNKLDVGNRTGAVITSIRLGMITLE